VLNIIELISTYRTALDDEIRERSADLTINLAPDHDSYLKAWASLEGIRRSRQIFDEMVKKAYE
jgi:hypothetical protein